jgi:hypothetical protein
VHQRRGQPVVAHRQARQGLVAGLLGAAAALKRGDIYGIYGNMPDVMEIFLEISMGLCQNIMEI